MKLGRVRGTLVATTVVDGLEGVRLLMVEPLTRDLEPAGDWFVAADGVAMAGPGELVAYVESREAALACPETFVPVDHAITAIVDQVDIYPGDSP